MLLIEDEPLIRMTIAEDIREAGYRVLEASTAEEGRQFMLADEPVTVVVTDVNLPGIDGIAFGRWILKEFPDVRIVLTSGIHENAVSARDVGEFLAKPFRTAELVALLRRFAPV